MVRRAPLAILSLAVAAAATADDQPAPTVTASHNERPDAAVAVSGSVITGAPSATHILHERGYVRPELIGYRSNNGYYWNAINCPEGSTWATHAGYGACCTYGAETCDYATSCAGNRVVHWGGRLGGDCGTSVCDTLTVYSNLDGTSKATATMTDVLCFNMIFSELDPRTAYKQTWDLRSTSTKTSTHAPQTTSTTSTRKPNAGPRVQAAAPEVAALIGAAALLL